MTAYRVKSSGARVASRGLTIVGGDRERHARPRRGRGRDYAPAALDLALLGGPSTSPLESASKTHLESHEELGAGAEDPSLDPERRTRHSGFVKGVL